MPYQKKLVRSSQPLVPNIKFEKIIRVICERKKDSIPLYIAKLRQHFGDLANTFHG
jgi:hypothetical protein